MYTVHVHPCSFTVHVTFLSQYMSHSCHYIFVSLPPRPSLALGREGRPEITVVSAQPMAGDVIPQPSLFTLPSPAQPHKAPAHRGHGSSQQPTADSSPASPHRPRPARRPAAESEPASKRDAPPPPRPQPTKRAPPPQPGKTSSATMSLKVIISTRRDPVGDAIHAALRYSICHDGMDYAFFTSQRGS